jgi:hypothetical protein
VNNVEGRERFFRAIAERIDVERVEEVHVFAAIRQGGRESGVAVLTLRPEPTESEIAVEAVETEGAEDQGDVASGESIAVGDEEVDYVDDVGVVDLDDVDLGDVDLGNEAVEPPPAPPAPRRFTVLRAHYRLQLKGPDRGKWEVAVVEEADAPSATVDEVVRGVHERAGGWSVEGPERLTGDEFRAALVEEPWSATR